MPEFTFREEPSGRKTATQAEDVPQALTHILRRIKGSGETRHIVRGTLLNINHGVLGEVNLMPCRAAPTTGPKTPNSGTG